MNFRPKKRIKVEFVIPDVRLGNLEVILREHTNKVTVEYLVESCYLSKVPSEILEETPGSTPSARQYNKLLENK